MTNSPGQLGHLGETKQVHVKQLGEPGAATVPTTAALNQDPLTRCGLVLPR